ncbi:hypothetical protein Srubr_46410 [Streptomyces rubradiris]|uniref:Uncharacterized protein n=1 Tax=Streptomyces rubradiris TaxID=285531 RepID=A0ABQ3RG41_STRRR|nr:hypothetical protein GCM10018792_53550 [Streptomyces rubradiris]GHI54795.1 hypothetical protein Srubr_46410 [Streptomyces rubradiris]
MEATGLVGADLINDHQSGETQQCLAHAFFGAIKGVTTTSSLKAAGSRRSVAEKGGPRTYGKPLDARQAPPAMRRASWYAPSGEGCRLPYRSCRLRSSGVIQVRGRGHGTNA